MLRSRPHILWTIFALISLLLFFVSIILHPRTTNQQSVASILEQKFKEKQYKLTLCIQEFKHFLNEQSPTFESLDSFTYSSDVIPQSDDYMFFVLSHDSLIYWSTYILKPEPIFKNTEKIYSGIIQTAQGYFYMISDTIRQITIYGLFPVYFSFPYKNKYFPFGYTNTFQIHRSLKTADFSLDPHAGHPIFDNEKQYVFSVVFQQTEQSQVFFWFAFILLILFLISSSNALFLLFAQWTKNKLLAAGLTALFLILIRWLQINYKIPSIVYEHQIFLPVLYAWNKWFSSFGDFLLNITILVAFSISLYRMSKQASSYFSHLQKRILLIATSFVFQIAYIAICYHIIFSVIVHSSFQLYLFDLLSWNIFDIIAFISILVINISFIFSATPVIAFIQRNLTTKKHKWIFLFSGILLALVLSIILQTPVIIVLLILPIYYAVLFFKKFIRSAPVLQWSMLTLFSSILSAYTYMQAHQQKQKDIASLFVVHLSSETDPIGEFYIEDIIHRIDEDTTYRRKLSLIREDRQSLSEYIINTYFQEYFTIYNIQITPCFATDSLLLLDQNVKVDCQNFFEALKQEQGKPTGIENVWRLEQITGRTQYLIDLVYDDTVLKQPLHIYIELHPTTRIAGTGYPELLIDEKYQSLQRFAEFTYAKYYQNQLVFQKGNVQYPLFLNNFTRYKLQEDKAHVHSFYEMNDNVTIILSKPRTKWLEILSVVSYFLLSITLCLLSISGIVNVSSVINKRHRWNLRSQLQIATIALVLVSFLAGAGVIINTFIDYYNNKHKELNRQKSYSILFEFEDLFTHAQNINDVDKVSLQQFLQHLNYTHFVDVNLFTTDGRLHATSRPQIYQTGIVSEYINPEALRIFHSSPVIFFTINENIGTLTYVSGYLPLYNKENNLLGYIQIPFFTQKTELQREIVTFLNTFISVYIVILAFAVMLALFLANYITRPLRIIGEKIRSIRPGQPNEKIMWKSSDDIGLLIQQYNKMIDELAARTQQLLETERARAWQQIARQIAHEIKNPLTPMKLSIQNLTRLYKDNPDEFARRFPSVSHVLIEQIEALTNIANTFSEYALMSQEPKKIINLKEFIEKLLPLYQHFRPTIQFNYDHAQKYMVYSGETQLMQIMNNLIRNAIDATQDREHPQITITLSVENNKVLVAVIDNGHGISEDIKPYIFQPHFTAKSGGTGLGLAITRQIIQSLGGHIWFETAENIGTTFYFTLSVAQNEKL